MLHQLRISSRTFLLVVSSNHSQRWPNDCRWCAGWISKLWSSKLLQRCYEKESHDPFAISYTPSHLHARSLIVVSTTGLRARGKIRGDKTSELAGHTICGRTLNSVSFYCDRGRPQCMRGFQDLKILLHRVRTSMTKNFGECRTMISH